VVIAVIAVRMVQSAVHKVVDVIAMRHLFMSAVRAVGVGAVDLRRARHGIGGINRDDMFVHVILVHMMEMSIMEIVHVTAMADRRVPASRAMPVNMVGVVFLGTCSHCRHSLRRLDCPSMQHCSSLNEIVTCASRGERPHA
jgi:hypothetical protein